MGDHPPGGANDERRGPRAARDGRGCSLREPLEPPIRNQVGSQAPPEPPASTTLRARFHVAAPSRSGASTTFHLAELEPAGHRLYTLCLDWTQNTDVPCHVAQASAPARKAGAATSVFTLLSCSGLFRASELYPPASSALQKPSRARQLPLILHVGARRHSSSVAAMHLRPIGSRVGSWTVVVPRSWQKRETHASAF